MMLSASAVNNSVEYCPYEVGSSLSLRRKSKPHDLCCTHQTHNNRLKRHRQIYKLPILHAVNCYCYCYYSSFFKLPVFHVNHTFGNYCGLLQQDQLTHWFESRLTSIQVHKRWALALRMHITKEPLGNTFSQTPYWGFAHGPRRRPMSPDRQDFGPTNANSWCHTW